MANCVEPLLLPLNPSEKVVQSSDSAPDHPSDPEIPTYQDWPPRYLVKADEIISHLSRIFSTPSGTDTLLLTLSYTSLLTSSILTSISQSRLRQTTRLFIEKSLILPPTISIILATKRPSYRLLIISRRLKALSSLISDVRIFARLWGLLGIWNWAKVVLLDKPHDDSLIRTIERIQVLANIAFQYLENVAYLSSKGVLGLSAEKQKQAWKWSSRFWALHVATEIIRIYRESALRRERVGKGESAQAEEGNNLKRQAFINAAYAPLTLHWSLEKGLISEFWVGLLGSVVGILKTQHLWKNTSE